MSQTVLVVEDNPITRKFVRVVLAGEGIEVIEAESGAAALSLIQAQAPDLVLQDLTLHDIDGFELVHRLRAALPSTPIIAYTGLNDEPRILRAGFTGLVLKPVEPDRLIQVVRAHLGVTAIGSLIMLPRTRTRDRAWNVVRTTLSRLTEIVGHSLTAERTLSSVLDSMLDASGFSMGFAATIEAGGAWRVCAQLGFGDELARYLALRWQAEHGPALALDETIELSRSGVAEYLEAAEIPSVLLVPLCHAGQQVGVLALASRNELHPDWRQLARLLSGPLAHAVTLARTANRLVASEHKFRGIAESTADGILLSDDSGTISYANASAAAILGKPSAELVGTRISRTIPVVTADRWSGNLTRGDDQIPVAISLRTFEDPPAHLNRVYVVRDLSEQLRVEAFSRLANLDALTGICNRRRFDEELRSRVPGGRRCRGEFAVLLVDLDQFKPINDTHGHAAGDAVLIAVAQTLKAHVRESDMVARLGGDEFAILLEHASLEGARTRADKLLQCLAKLSVPFSGVNLRAGASIGIATFPSDGRSREELLDAADRALYRAKRQGRNRAAISDARLVRGTSNPDGLGREDSIPQPAPRRNDEPAGLVDDGEWRVGPSLDKHS